MGKESIIPLPHCDTVIAMVVLSLGSYGCNLRFRIYRCVFLGQLTVLFLFLVMFVLMEGGQAPRGGGCSHYQ